MCADEGARFAPSPTKLEATYGSHAPFAWPQSSHSPHCSPVRPPHASFAPAPEGMNHSRSRRSVRWSLHRSPRRTPPLATYDGGEAGHRADEARQGQATRLALGQRAEVRRRTSRSSRHEVAEDAGVTADTTYQVTLNGFSAESHRGAGVAKLPRRPRECSGCSPTRSAIRTRCRRPSSSASRGPAGRRVGGARRNR